ncbi:MAG TPA: hypothetical protein VFG30_11660 [Polyangiales bacterium]|nr:hypothetical protein [Polyangiales bacterium]
MPKTKKKTASKSGPRLNKSEWIRSQPPSAPAKDVVSKAKAEGIKLSLAQVYTARSAAKKKAGRIGKPGRPKGSGASATVSVKALGLKARANDDVRTEFVKIAMRIGTDEAQRLLDRIIDVQTPSSR